MVKTVEELKKFARIPNLDKAYGITVPQYLFTEKQLNEFLEQYAQQVSRNEKKYDSFWFDVFNERYPDEVREIMDSNIYSQK